MPSFSHMEISKSSIVNIASITLLITGLFYIFLVSSISSPTSVLSSFRSCSYGSRESEGLAAKLGELDLALRKASMPGQTVIIAIVNRAYADPGNSVDSDRTMLDVFLESFWLGEGTRELLDHVMIVAMDQIAYEMCRFRRLICYRLKTDGVDFAAEELYMSKDFIKMMWRRTSFLADILRRGYSFIFTDTDVMWLRNPFARLSNETADLQISTDKFNGNPLSEANNINTGFYFVRSNNRTVSLFETWYSMKENATGKKEQDVLIDLKRSGIFRKLGLEVRFLDTLYFSGFCSDSREFGAVTTVHANCCQTIAAKISDLTMVLKDWKLYKASSHWAAKDRNNMTVAYQWSKHMNCKKSWTKMNKRVY